MTVCGNPDDVKTDTVAALASNSACSSSDEWSAGSSSELLITFDDDTMFGVTL